ncbi:MAG: zinc ABC transporter substrate-binding protein, partial [Deltaproteobacteria bacterium]|nr:zinc ABC transporter substrate-binding protein [Deltaproteobacteria bacterium]
MLISVGLICPPTGDAADKFTVFVTLAPQKYFVEQIGKNRVEVHVMVPPGADPHTYEPKPRQMMALSKAKLYFAVGVEFEEAKLEKILSAHPKLKVIRTDEGIAKKPMITSGLHADAQGDLHGEGEGHAVDKKENDLHDHDGRDPHIWLSPPLVKIQARTILNALQEIDPVHR